MEMALVVIGLFVLVWIISAVVKATQDPGSKRSSSANRQRPIDNSPRPEKTSNNDLDRFMAEIDRLRRRGDGAPAGRRMSGEPPRSRAGGDAPRPRPIQDQPPRPVERTERPRLSDRERRERDRERERERRPRTSSRPPVPPPLPRTDSVPVLRPVAPETPTPPAPPTPTSAKPAKPARPSSPATAIAQTPVVQALQAVLKSKQGPAAAFLLSEIFGPPPSKRAQMGQRS